MSLVNYNILPLELHQRAHANSHTFKSCDAHVEIARLQLVFNDIVSAFLLGDEIDHSDLWTPTIEF